MSRINNGVHFITTTRLPLANYGSGCYFDNEFAIFFLPLRKYKLSGLYLKYITTFALKKIKRIIRIGFLAQL